ncbi:MAG TPA: NAD(P)/FAD-dependent oxidoreductase [Rudaea sp.]|jgi:cation diffusion facilitator CzcD-associated flavoprotein CzcO
MVDDAATIIVGAGPAGLAVAAALRRRNVPFGILERNDSVASSWRGHYERLHLHTPKNHSALPFVAFPTSFPRYPSRDQMIEYLEDYARRFELRPQFGIDVQRCTRNADGAWDVQTNRNTHRARHLVIASGFSRIAHRPSWPGLEAFGGPVLHSSEYGSGRRFSGQTVLVVGFGNSGAEIALDLAECGARSAVAVRGAVNIIPRDLLGIPVIELALAGRLLPPRIADKFNTLAMRLTIGDLSRFAIRKRSDGPVVEILQGRQIPVIDVGTVAAIRSGAIRVHPAITSFAPGEARFVDGTSGKFDAVILATGYATGLRALFADEPDVLDDTGLPRASRSEAEPGLYFCGFNLVPTGLLREIAIEAVRIGNQITS